MKTVFGYNIIFRIEEDDGLGGTVEKLIAGTTSNTFTITPEVKETITKEDKGFKKSKVTGYGYEFTAEGLVNISESGDTGDKLSKSDIISLTISGGEISFVYGGTEAGDKVIKGKVIITGYTENSDSENEATYSINFKGVTEFEEDTV